MTEQKEPELPGFLAHPDRTDKVLFAALILMGLWSLALIPLRAWLLSHPLIYTLAVGGYTSAVVSGANASVGNGIWWVYLLCSVVGAVKFMPVYWAMGRKWGMEFIDMSLQYMPRAHRFFQKAVASESTRMYAGTLAFIPLGYLPGPVPNTVVNAVAGLLKIRFLVMLAVNVLSILAVNGLFMWLGLTYGDQVLEVVEVINKYLLWITLGLVALMVFRGWRQNKKKAGA
ncbi:DedA family protein [Corynebacterium nasicanis]|uniref:DedA family protein n=1 Tax=Corynebacterium nasicanis TaxID=1448267 RepID=A0ABW1Q8U4_9CORY